MVTKILIVDDEPAIGRLLVYQLRECGYLAVHEPDALCALPRLERERPDLVLLDVMMPAMNGWEVCRQIRACSSVPIIMLTAKSADLDVATGLDAGADDHVGKPCSIVQLRARIEAVLRRARAVRSPAGQHPTSGLQRGMVGEREEGRDGPAARSTLAEAALPAGGESPPVAVPSPSGLAPQSIGGRLRQARQARGLSLLQAERACRVRWEFLQAIEYNNYDYVPRAQLRRAIVAYAGLLGFSLSDLSGTTPARTPRLVAPAYVAALALILVALVAVGLILLA